MSREEMPSPTMESGSNNNVPAFLAKLWKLVEDESCNDLIEWGSNGTTFFIRDQSRLSRELLPHYFKHNNVASFIRQLNMYGFRKVMHVDRGGLRVEKDEIEFQHPFFVRDNEYLLQLIKRKIPVVKSTPAEESKLQPDLVTKVLLDVKNLHGKQESMDNKLSAMKRENEALWREVASLRQKHMKQQQIVSQLVQFLLRLVNSNRGIVPKRKRTLMLQDSDGANSKVPRIKRNFSFDGNTSKHLSSSGATIFPGSPSSGPLIHDVTDSADTETYLAGDVGIIVDSPTGFDTGVTQPTPDPPLPSASPDPMATAVRAIYSPTFGAEVAEDEDSTEQPSSPAWPDVNTKISLSDDGATPGVHHLNELIREINERTTVDGAGPSAMTVSAFDSVVPLDNVVAIGDNSLNKSDFVDHGEGVPKGLESIMDYLSNSAFNLDVSALRGLFNDDLLSSRSMSDMGDYGKSIENTGTELMQYTPNISDLLDPPLFNTDLVADGIEDRMFDPVDDVDDYLYKDEDTVPALLETPEVNGISLEDALADLEAATPIAKTDTTANISPTAALTTTTATSHSSPQTTGKDIRKAVRKKKREAFIL